MAEGRFVYEGVKWLNQYDGRQHVFEGPPGDALRQEVLTWCRERFGPAVAQGWSYYFNDRVSIMWFPARNTDEAFEFRMRWC